MSKIEVVVIDRKENSIDVGRHIDLIKQLVSERNEAWQQMLDAEESLSGAEELFSEAEYALQGAREKLKDYLVDEGVL